MRVTTIAAAAMTGAAAMKMPLWINESTICEGGHCDTEVAVAQDVLRIVAGVSGGTLKGNTIELGWY